ncbi:MAG: SLATT domain-containing protein [Desulfobaccales bacterium]|jgi:hypothetical protein
MTSNEPTTTEKTVTISKGAIINEAKRIFEDCLHTSKSHFVTASYWDNFHLKIGIPTVILAGIAGTLAFAAFSYHDTLAGIFSMIIVVLTAVTTFLNPKERAIAHLTAGNNYASIVGKIRIFWTIECWEETPEKLLADKLKEFSDWRDKLNHDCPQPPQWAYRVAKKGIEEGEAEYMVDKKPPSKSEE